MELTKVNCGHEDVRAAAAVVMCSAFAAELALPADHQDQHLIPLALGNTQLVAIIAESPLTEDLSELRLGITRLAARGALRESGTHREGSSIAGRLSACNPIYGGSSRPGKEILGGSLGELPAVVAGRSWATSGDCQEAPVAAQERVAGEAASGRGPLRAIGPGQRRL